MGKPRSIRGFKTAKYHLFQGRWRTIAEISTLTGIRRDTLSHRVVRDIPLDRPLLARRSRPSSRTGLRLTGDRDLKAIITARHQHGARLYLENGRRQGAQ